MRSTAARRTRESGRAGRAGRAPPVPAPAPRRAAHCTAPPSACAPPPAPARPAPGVPGTGCGRPRRTPQSRWRGHRARRAPADPAARPRRARASGAARRPRRRRRRRRPAPPRSAPGAPRAQHAGRAIVVGRWLHALDPKRRLEFGRELQLSDARRRRVARPREVAARAREAEVAVAERRLQLGAARQVRLVRAEVGDERGVERRLRRVVGRRVDVVTRAAHLAMRPPQIDDLQGTTSRRSAFFRRSSAKLPAFFF